MQGKKIKKILLVIPPFYTLLNDYSDRPLNGVCSLAAVLYKEGFDVSILNTDNIKHALPSLKHSPYKKNLIDENDEAIYIQTIKDISLPFWGDIKNEIYSYSPDAVGISSLTPNFNSAINVAKLVKSIDPNIRVILGGVHPTFTPEETLKNKDVDFVVRGEGEYTLLNLICALNGANNLDKVSGVSYRMGDSIVHNKRAELIDDLDSLPFPMKELDLDIDIYSSESLGAMMTSRGCPFSCIYCASSKFWGKRVRFRSIENVIEEIKQIKKKFGTRFFIFDDDTFNINRNRVISLCDAIIREKLNIEWWCEIRPSPIDKEMVTKMKNAGCVSIALGVETGNESTLKNIKKGATLTQIRRCIDIIRKQNIELGTFFMIGFPWEGEREISETIKFMKSIKSSGTVNLSIATPYPGTELYELLISEGMIKGQINWGLCFHHRRKNFFNKNFSDAEFLKIVANAEKECEKINIKNFMSRTIRKQLLNPKKMFQYIRKYATRPKQFLSKLGEYFIALQKLINFKK